MCVSLNSGAKSDVTSNVSGLQVNGHSVSWSATQDLPQHDLPVLFFDRAEDAIQFIQVIRRASQARRRDLNQMNRRISMYVVGDWPGRVKANRESVQDPVLLDPLRGFRVMLLLLLSFVFWGLVIFLPHVL